MKRHNQALGVLPDPFTQPQLSREQTVREVLQLSGLTKGSPEYRDTLSRTIDYLQDINANTLRNMYNKTWTFCSLFDRDFKDEFFIRIKAFRKKAKDRQAQELRKLYLDRKHRTRI